jgi:polar amino acid transport system substrate-binding protein
LLLILLEIAALGQEPSAQLVNEIAPTGSLRVAINLGNAVLAQKGPEGTLQGISAGLALELGRRLSVPVTFVTFEAAGEVVTALGGSKTWDVAFLAIDPQRAQTIAFSPPYVIIEGAYMVPQLSPITGNEQVDRAGIRVAVGRNSAYDLYLGRNLKAAQRVFAPTSQDAIALFRRDGLEVAASVRQVLERYASGHPDVRLLPGHFMIIEQAVATPKDRPAAAGYMRGFIEEMMSSGFVARELEKSGQLDARVAPAASKQ